MSKTDDQEVMSLVFKKKKTQKDFKQLNQLMNKVKARISKEYNESHPDVMIKTKVILTCGHSHQKITLGTTEWEHFEVYPSTSYPPSGSLCKQCNTFVGMQKLIIERID